MTAPFMVIRRRQLRTAYPVTGHINRLPQVTVEIDGHVPAPPRLRLLAGRPQQRRHEAAHHDAPRGDLGGARRGRIPRRLLQALQEVAEDEGRLSVPLPLAQRQGTQDQVGRPPREALADALHQQQVRRSREHEAPRAVRVHRQLDGAQHLGRALHLVEDDLATPLPQCGGERGRLAADLGIVEREIVPGAARGTLSYEGGLAGLSRSRGAHGATRQPWGERIVPESALTEDGVLERPPGLLTLRVWRSFTHLPDCSYDIIMRIDFDAAKSAQNAEV